MATDPWSAAFDPNWLTSLTSPSGMNTLNPGTVDALKRWAQQQGFLNQPWGSVSGFQLPGTEGSGNYYSFDPSSGGYRLAPPAAPSFDQWAAMVAPEGADPSNPDTQWQYQQWVQQNITDNADPTRLNNPRDVIAAINQYANPQQYQASAQTWGSMDPLQKAALASTAGAVGYASGAVGGPVAGSLIGSLVGGEAGGSGGAIAGGLGGAAGASGVGNLSGASGSPALTGSSGTDVIDPYAGSIPGDPNYGGSQVPPQFSGGVIDPSSGLTSSGLYNPLSDLSGLAAPLAISNPSLAPSPIAAPASTPSTSGTNMDPIDIFGSTLDTPGFSTDPGLWNPVGNTTLPGTTGGSSGGIWDWLTNTLGRSGSPGASGASGNTGGNILSTILNNPVDSAFNMTPFMLALNQANHQGNDIQQTIDRMNQLSDSVAGNASPYAKAVIDPYDIQTGQARNALTESLQNRGVMGSSFGDQSLNNFDYTRGVGRGDIMSKALLGSTGLQGNILNSVLGATNAKNAVTNQLLGAGLGASGNLFRSTPASSGLLGTTLGSSPIDWNTLLGGGNPLMNSNPFTGLTG